MNKKEVGMPDVPAPPKTAEEQEALRLYMLLKDITTHGCDAEVKNVKGVLKVLKVRKTEPTTFHIGN